MTLYATGTIIDYLSNESVDSIIEKQKQKSVTIKQLCTEPVIVFGAADEGIRLLEILIQLNAKNIRIIDMDKKKHGTALFNDYIIEPFTSSLIKNSHVILATHRTLKPYELSLESNADSITTFLHLQNLYPEIFKPHFFHENMLTTLSNSASLLSDLRTTLADDTSREVLSACLNYRVYGDPRVFIDIVDWNLYSPRGLDLLPYSRVYVDCGSYDGDSVKIHLQKYPNNIDKIFAFEPDPKTFIRLEANMDQYKMVTCFNLGIGEKVDKLFFNSEKERASLFSPKGDVSIDITSLDTIIFDSIPTFIKMNIEAFEPHAINGAKNIITNHQPALALSVYHQPEHLFSLQLQIEKIAPNKYDYYLRQHDGGLVETVLYAIPKRK